MGEFLQVKSWIDYTEDGAIDSPAVVIWKHKGGKKLGMCEYCYSHDIEIPSTYYSCDEWFEVTGPKGLIMVNTCTGELLQGPSVSVFTKDGWKYYSDIESDWASSFVGATHNFVNSILGKEKPLLVPEDGIEILKFSFAIQESDKTSSEIHLD
jgi:predicted dehydrogenase